MSEANQADPPSDSSQAPERGGWVAVPARRVRANEAADVDDSVTEEWPVALVYNGISHAVMMATPRDLEYLGIGFSVSEGIVASRSAILDIEVEMGAESAEIRLTLLQQAFMALKDHRRSMAGRSGCGVCGIESIELLDLHPLPIKARTAADDIPATAIARAARELPAHQTISRLTGGAHAAAWCSKSGEIRHVFEDVGRHNAMDKLLGKLLSARASTTDGFVFLSSRASYELVRKAARLDIPLVATISAPTSLAIDIATRAGVRLVSFCRGDGFVDFTARRGAG
ncbi:MAG: formate dehydrogenase accessory sulfurtransferase FdhD [Janthinobacterium lividum]